MAFNSKNPTGLFFARMAKATKEAPGTLVSLMTNFFRANYGDITLPKTAADFIIYDQLAVVGLTTANFFQGQWTASRSNFPNGTFVAGQSEHMIITGIRLLDGAGAAIQSIGWQPGIGDAISKNGMSTITINGQTVLLDHPNTAYDSNVLSATASGETDENRGFYFFYEPLVVLGQTQLKLTMNFATAPTTANYSIRVELHGVRFIGG
jgi:hypothetical protein